MRPVIKLSNLNCFITKVIRVIHAHQTNKKEYKAVTALHKYIVSTILAMVFTMGDTLWATPNHPFWFKEAYVEASTLKVGDTLHTQDGTYKIIQEIITYDKPERVYNLTVADNKNYVVTAEGILVHNTCFLARVSDNPGLISKIDALPEDLKAAFIKDFYNAGDEVVGLFKKNPEWVRVWEGMLESIDNGIKEIRTNAIQLQKFNDLIVYNNLGLDKNGILDVLNAASKKGYNWDFPDKVLDGIKRASDANIPGLKVGYKKFPESAGSGGGFLIPAKNYQRAASGDANLSFELMVEVLMILV